MKIIFLSTVFLIQLIFGIPACCQQDSAVSTGYRADKKDVNQKILESGRNYDVNFDISNHEAFFLEGEDSLFRYIYSHLIIPESAIASNLSANAMLGFQVGFDGKVAQAHSISRVGEGIDEQLIELLNKLEFVAARQNNIPYRSEVILEIPVKAVYLRNVFGR